MKKKIISFNLNERYPDVLLLGNGLFRGTGIPWSELIEQTARNGNLIQKYRKGKNAFLIPNYILTLATGIVDDNERHQKYAKVIKEKTEDTSSRYSEMIAQLSADAILTTNYTYQIENIFRQDYEKLSDATKRKYSYVTCEEENEINKRYNLYSYNRPSEDACPIWHIHGELRKPSSLVMSLDEYARLIGKIIDYNQKNGDRYEKTRENMQIRAWQDYLIIGNVYVLGFDYDFSEFDMWWLLNRRIREKTPVGKFIYYGIDKTDKSNEIKKYVMNDLSNVEYRSMGLTLPVNSNKEESNNFYIEFYNRALKDIKREIESNQRKGNYYANL